jgi:peptidoglycan hydrolase-like protein with peptidoglycan-binding domain
MMERVMKKLTLTLLAGAALALPAAVPAMAQGSPQGSPQNQQPQAQQQSPQNTQANQPQSSQQQSSDQQASNKPISPQQIGRNGVRQVQQALDKDGFHAGRADGIFGHHTQTAVNDFQKSKNIQGSGQLNQQTLSELGVNVASNQNPGNQDGGDMNSAPNHNQ